MQLVFNRRSASDHVRHATARSPRRSRFMNRPFARHRRLRRPIEPSIRCAIHASDPILPNCCRRGNPPSHHCPTTGSSSRSAPRTRSTHPTQAGPLHGRSPLRSTASRCRCARVFIRHHSPTMTGTCRAASRIIALPYATNNRYSHIAGTGTNVSMAMM